MQEENKFPKIKSVKLKEEQNNQNKNSKDNNNNNKIEKENKNKNKCVNKTTFLNILSCFGYFFFLFLIISIFSLNYYYTKNAFDENKNVILPADQLCKIVINNMANCLEEKTFNKCLNENKNMEYCYDEVHFFNQKCYIFISELELCYRKNRFIKGNNKCKDLEKNLIKCGSSYKHMNIKEIKIKDLFALK